MKQYQTSMTWTERERERGREREHLDSDGVVDGVWSNEDVGKCVDIAPKIGYTSFVQCSKDQQFKKHIEMKN